MTPPERVGPRPRWRSQTLAAFDAPYFPRILLSGAIWNITRWMNLFLGAFLAAELTESPILLQLVGATIFAPFLLGGAIGGLISDRFDRRLTVIAYLTFLTPISLAIAALVLTGEIRIWMLYPYGILAGFGWVVDLTTRRALVADVVGPELVTNAFSLEALSSSFGGVLGAIGGGAIIGLIGIGEAYLVVSVLLVAAVVVLLTVPSHTRIQTATAPWREDLRAGIAMLPRQRPLVSILGVTLVMNLFFFSYVSFVPEIAEDLGVSAFATGVLSAANTIGAMCAAILVASMRNPPRGRLYVFGSFFALVLMPVFALANVYALALAALILSGFGVGGFVTMQFTLVTGAVEPAARGRALGLMSTVIGVLPFGSILLGLIAESIGVGPAIAASAGAGILLLVLWLLRWPEALRLP
ncbi:MAG: MFS family permease/Predicted arabinose efflux permease, MFS family [Chloroflexi bacterium]|nr:MAG: MFS family permease/Predicted arabinose efflux permease, MFS family [Chloroflexota bacterium]